MRVLQVTATARRRGAEVFADDLGRALSARSHVVRTFALEPGPPGAPMDLPVIGDRARAPRTIRDLRREIRRTDITVAHGSSSLLTTAVAAAGIAVPFVYRSIGDPAYWRRSFFRQRAVVALLRRARRVVVLWPGAAASLAEHGLDPARIAVIPNGVPVERFPLVDDERRTRARRELRVDAAPLAVYVGSLSPEKGVDVVIAALRYAPTWRLLVVGDGPERPALERLADDEAPDRVRFLGALAAPAQAYAAADAVVLPSRTEGMAAALIEACLTGVPVVATAVGAAREVVADDDVGQLVPPDDPASFGHALCQVHARPRSGHDARARCAAAFGIDAVVERWEELLHRVVAGG